MDAPGHMPCQELVEVVTDYLEGTLSARDRARLEAHLAVCPPCVVYLDQMREVVALAGRVPAEELPAVVRDRLVEAFRGWRAA
jgi:anti-sigma factor (TIGR02949 family)